MREMKTTGYFVDLDPEEIKEIRRKYSEQITVATISDEYNLPEKVIAQITGNVEELEIF